MSLDEALLEADGVDRALSDAKLLLGRVRAANVDPHLHITPVDSPVNAVFRGIWCAFQSRGWCFGYHQLDRRVVRSVGREENVDCDAVFGYRGRPAGGVRSIAPAQCVRAVVRRERVPASGQLCEGDDWWWLCDHVFVSITSYEAVETESDRWAADSAWASVRGCPLRLVVCT